MSSTTVQPRESVAAEAAREYKDEFHPSCPPADLGRYFYWKDTYARWVYTTAELHKYKQLGFRDEIIAEAIYPEFGLSYREGDATGFQGQVLNSAIQVLPPTLSVDEMDESMSDRFNVAS